MVSQGQDAFSLSCTILMILFLKLVMGAFFVVAVKNMLFSAIV